MGKGNQPTRSCSFRIPVPAWDDLEAYAQAFGLDVSAVLNWMVAEMRPLLVRRLVRYRENLGHAERRRAAAEGP